MTELDVEALKRAQDWLRWIIDETNNLAVQSHARTLIAALEDRDRLRAAVRRAIERTNTMHPWTHDDGTVLSLHLFPEDYEALRAALERRDG